MRQRYLTIAFICALLAMVALGALVPLSPAKAQSGSWSYTWSFDSTTEGWEITGGKGIVCCGGQFWGVEFSGNRYLVATIQLPHGGYVTHMELTYSVTNRILTTTGILDLHGQPEGYKFSLDDATVGNGGSSGGEKTISSDFAATFTDSFDLFLSSSGAGSTNYITSITISGVDCDPFGAACATATPSPTPTGTPTIPAPPSQPIVAGGACTLLPMSIATMSDLSQWRVVSNGVVIEVTNPPGVRGLPLTDATATLPLNLDATAQYQIIVSFHIGESITSDSFTVGLGTATHTVPIDDTLIEQQWTGPQQTYQQTRDDSMYDLSITKELATPNPELVIDFVCIKLIETDGSGAAVPAALVSVECKNCAYQPVGDLFQDIPRLFDWLICVLRNLFTCQLALMINGLWTRIVQIISIIAMLRLWAAKIIEGFGTWVITSIRILAAWGTGHALNFLTIIQSVVTGIINWLDIPGFFNRAILFIATLPEQIAAFINNAGTFVGGLFSTIGGIVSLVLNIIATVIGLIGSVIWKVITTIADVLAIIPQVIASTVNGFNNNSSIPLWAPTCNDHNTFFYTPCLSMYVLDNTIFEGPEYYVILVTMGFVSFHTFLWFIDEIKGVMEKS